MAGIPQVTKSGPRTYIPAELILGGQLVEGRAGGRIGVAAAGSVKVLGVALTDAQSPDTLVTTPTTVGGYPNLNVAPLPTSVGVSYSGTETPVKYSAAAQFGDQLAATAGGTVAPIGATPDARAIVGKCTAPAGVAAGAVGLMRIA
ncbi:hypothetical protein ACT89R_01715 [Rhodococcus qingshengii]